MSSRKEFHELIFSNYIFSYVCNTLKIIKQKIHFVHLQIHFNNINEHKKMFAYFCSINLLMMDWIFCQIKQPWAFSLNYCIWVILQLFK